MPYKNKEDRNRKLREKRNKKINSDDETIMSEISEHSSLTEENSILSIQLEELKEKYTELKEKYKELESKNENLQTQLNLHKEFSNYKTGILDKLIESKNPAPAQPKGQYIPKPKAPTPEEKRLEKLKQIQDNTMSIEEFMDNFEIKDEEFNLTAYTHDIHGFLHKETCIIEKMVNRVIKKCKNENKFLPIQAFNQRPPKYYVRVEEMKECYNDKYVGENKKWIYCDDNFVFKTIKTYINDNFLANLLKEKDDEALKQNGPFKIVKRIPTEYDEGPKYYEEITDNPNNKFYYDKLNENIAKYTPFNDDCVPSSKKLLLPLFKMKE